MRSHTLAPGPALATLLAGTLALLVLAYGIVTPDPAPRLPLQAAAGP